MDGLQLHENRADENLRFHAQQKAIGIVRAPKIGATKFAVRFQLEIFADPLQFWGEFDRVISAAANGDLLMTDHRNGDEIGAGGRISYRAVDASFRERLAAQIKHDGLK